MSNELLAAKVTNAALSGGTFGASVASVIIQLSHTHDYMGLSLPLWVFFVASVILCLAGGFLSLSMDYVKRLDGSVFGKLSKAVIVGLVVAFVILPAVTPTLNVIYLMIASFFASLSGAVLLHIIFDVLGDGDMHKSAGEWLKSLIIGFFKRFGGGNG